VAGPNCHIVRTGDCIYTGRDTTHSCQLRSVEQMPLTLWCARARSRTQGMYAPTRHVIKWHGGHVRAWRPGILTRARSLVEHEALRSAAAALCLRANDRLHVPDCTLLLHLTHTTTTTLCVPTEAATRPHVSVAADPDVLAEGGADAVPADV
jgi:hypothetical protein